MKINGREVQEPPRESRPGEPFITITTDHDVYAVTWPLAEDTIDALKAELDRLVATPVLELPELRMQVQAIRGNLVFQRGQGASAGQAGVLGRQTIRQLKELCERALQEK